MRTLESWLDQYAESHQNPTNKIIHKICVPTIVWTILAMLRCIPVPQATEISQWLNVSTLFAVLCLIFYFTINVKSFFGMLIVVLPVLALNEKIYETGMMLPVAVTTFFVAWIGQFIGHKIEGKKPSFFTDLVFLLIGPLWALESFYQVTGIRRDYHGIATGQRDLKV